MAEARRASGVVSEREDLLDGRLRVELEGDAEGWSVAASFGWRRGREGAVALDEGELTLVSGAGEAYASLDAGSVTTDPDTGVTTVRVGFIVDGSTGDWLRPGERISGDFSIHAREWSGELRAGSG